MTSDIVHWRRSLSAALLIISALYFVFSWLSYDEAWIHPEQIRAAAYIWTPNTNSYLQLLRKAFDWAALDTADPTHWQQQTPAQRVRPLSDVAQVIDAIARPAITRVLYAHPSFTPSAILAAIFAPLFFFRFLRLTFNSTTLAFALTALWLSSTGFLSIIIPDIHAAAKRLSILLLCLSLYLAARHERDNKQSTFWESVSALFLSLFTDEMALGAYIAVCCLFIPTFLRAGTRWKALVVLGLPAAFIIMANWGLPAFYAIASADGTPTFVPIADQKKLGLIIHLGHWRFYYFALIQTARAILSTIGMSVQNVTTECIALIALIGGSAWLAWKSTSRAIDRHMPYGMAASAIVLIANGIYLTLLDLYPPATYPLGQYPPAGGTTYLASYTYYYHSSLSVFSVLWLAHVCRATMNLEWTNVRIRSLLSSAGLSLSVVAIVLNFWLFQNINQLVALTHLYPLQPSELYKKIESVGARIAKSTSNDVIPVEFNSNCSIVTERFTRIFAEMMGETWQTNPFNTYFAKFSFSPEDLVHLLNAHYPLNKFSARISSDLSGCGDPHLFLSAASGPPGVQLLLSGKGFKPHAKVDFFWDSAGGLLLGSVYADSSGTFADFPAEIPYHGIATYNIFASGYTGLTSTSYTITTSPVVKVSVTPNQASPGGKIVVAGSGFMVGTVYSIRWNGLDGLAIGTGTVDMYGKVPPTTVHIPEVAAGNYQLYVTDDHNQTSLVPFTVASSPEE